MSDHLEAKQMASDKLRFKAEMDNCLAMAIKIRKEYISEMRSLLEEFLINAEHYENLDKGFDRSAHKRLEQFVKEMAL